MRTKKGVKKLNERLDNTNDGLYHTSNQFSHCRIELNRELDSHFQLTFTLHYRNNNLIFEQNRVTKRQEITYKFISYLHYDLGWSYRKITKKMNGWGIKTHKGLRV